MVRNIKQFILGVFFVGILFVMTTTLSACSSGNSGVSRAKTAEAQGSEEFQLDAEQENDMDNDESGSSAEESNAVESNESVSDEEGSSATESDEDNLDEENNTEIDTTQFEQYQKYGLVYKESEKRFYFKNKLVRKFVDRKDSEGNIITFSFTDGEVDLEAKRNASFNLIGIQVLSQDEFDKNTKLINEDADLGNATAVSIEGSDNVDTTLNDFISYGLSYNSQRDVWQYKGKDIYIFYDEEGCKLIQGNAKREKRMSLVVERNSKKKNIKLSIIEDRDIEAYERALLGADA